ncbi:MAG: oxaloacetate decarboxylase, gamma subunit [Methyloprofundus sp.]|nr:MAG: oxaloacetate decarboxylase, gamma subunit [Methyloprofundus sp.]
MNEKMTQGVELMLTGMGIVFLFLVMLIGAVKLMAYCVATYFPEEASVNTAPNSATPANAVTPVVAAAITGAVHQHRAKKK